MSAVVKTVPRLHVYILRRMRFFTHTHTHTDTHTHHEVLLQRRPGVHDRHRGHGVQSLQGDDLLGELGEPAVHCALDGTAEEHGSEYGSEHAPPAQSRRVLPCGTDLSGSSQGADGRHDVNRLDPPGLPLLVQDVGPIHDVLAVGVEHALEE